MSPHNRNKNRRSKNQRFGLLLNPNSEVGKKLAGADDTALAKQIEKDKRPGINFRPSSNNKIPIE